MIAVFQQIAVDQTSDHRRTFDLLATVREMVDLTRLAHRHDPIEIIVTGETDLMLDSYPGSIGQVLNQLIENAIVHGFARTGEGTISVRVWPSGHDAVRITVHDNGVGIPRRRPAAGVRAVLHHAARAGRQRPGPDDLRATWSTASSAAASSSCRRRGAGTTVTMTLPRLAPRSHG